MTILGVSTAAAMVLSYLESFIPLSIAVPGVKLGLANLVTVFLLIKLDFKSAAAVGILRVSLTALLFGSFASFAYSAAGAVLSIVTMSLLKKTERFSAVGISVAGGVAHNMGQILMAIVIMSTGEIAYWLPPLIISGVVTGLAVGSAGAVLVSKIKLDTH